MSKTGLDAPRSYPTAQYRLSGGQRALGFAFVMLIGFGLYMNPHQTELGFVAFAMLFWLLFVGFKTLVWAASFGYHAHQNRLINMNDPSLPTYTLFLPMRHEPTMVKPLVEAIQKLQYPVEKLQVLICLEEDDTVTREALEDFDLPEYFEVVLVPKPEPGTPRTKPRAMNVGLERATGEYCVIYDAEDRMASDQLLKAALWFRQQKDRRFACVQARLFFWNGDTNIITRFYRVEYVVHFEWVLPGLARLGLTPPLGGTSNHFLTHAVRDVVGGWDPFNVTEDADMAARLARAGYRIGILDSVTYEAASSTLRSADRQRRRWLKGYLQTGLVHTRQPIKAIREMGFVQWFCFNLLMFGTIISLLLNPLFWAATIVFFATRATFIVQLFPLPLFYMGVVLMVVGNFVLFYQMVLASMTHDNHGNVKYMFLLILSWAFTTWSVYLAVLGWAFRPHHWNKTEHTHDVSKEENLEELIA